MNNFHFSLDGFLVIDYICVNDYDQLSLLV